LLRRALRLAPETLGQFVRYRLLQPLRSRPFAPRALHYVATHRCNARCVMCGIWREHEPERAELGLDGLAALLADRLFRELRYVGISGGEPFLRGDLPEIAALFRAHCPRLRRISITTNGLLPQRIAASIGRLGELASESGVLLDVSISCHAFGERLGELVGVPGAFERVRETVDVLDAARRAGRLTLSMNCVVLEKNLDELDRLIGWTRERRIPLSFVMGEVRSRFANQDMAQALLPAERKEALVAFFEERSRDLSLSGPASLRYRELARLLRDPRGRRSLACYYAMGGFVLGPDGSLYYCSHSRKIGNGRERSAQEAFYDPAQLAYRRRELLEKECLRCPPYTLTRWELQASLDRVVPLLCRQLLERWATRLDGRSR
jgi:MoaA/NifB/PqqE/SkfB family radical SAM enzyme